MPSYPASGPPNWMSDCLEAAKAVMKTHHRFCTCDPESFFRDTTYDVYIQRDRWGAYAYITVGRGSRHFPIGVHPVLAESVPWKQRALTVVFMHELLHALHPEWGHERVNPEQRLLANKGGYADALVELVRLWVNGKLLSCGS